VRVPLEPAEICPEIFKDIFDFLRDETVMVPV